MVPEEGENAFLRELGLVRVLAEDVDDGPPVDYLHVMIIQT